MKDVEATTGPVTVKELVGTIADLRSALDDASGVVDKSPDEAYAYQAELEAAKDVMDRYYDHGVLPPTAGIVAAAVESARLRQPSAPGASR